VTNCDGDLPFQQSVCEFDVLFRFTAELHSIDY